MCLASILVLIKQIFGGLFMIKRELEPDEDNLNYDNDGQLILPLISETSSSNTLTNPPSNNKITTKIMIGIY